MEKTLLSLFLCLSSYLFAQTTPQDMVAKMGRGINLGNTLSAAFEGNWAPAVEESYFDDITSVGFKTVRIPIRFDEHTTKLEDVTYKDAGGNYIGNTSDYTVETAYLDRIEEVTDWALERGLVAIIDVHGDHWFWESYREIKQGSANSEYKTGADREAAVDRFKAIWTAISNRFQGKSENLLFEIMNEAYFAMNAAEVDATNTYILDIIRATNPTRNVIICGGGKNSYEAPLQIATSYPDNNNYLHNDNYLIATYHYYWPRAFTASSGVNENDFDWGTTADKDNIDSDFGEVKAWSMANNTPILLGEFGADNEGGYDYSKQTYGANGGPEVTSRADFHRYLAQKAIDLGFAFTVWDAGDKSNKTIYKVTDRTWVSDVRNAVLGITCLEVDMIKNADLECGYNSDWNLVVGGTAAASYSNTTVSDIYENNESLKIEVTSVGAAHSNVVLKNQVYTKAISGETITFQTVAKASNLTESQNFKFRLKVTDNSNNISYDLISNALNLTTSYQSFEYTCTVPANTKQVEFQLLCGKKAGTYYFDNFNAITNQTLDVATENLPNNNQLIIYPNPATDKVFFKTTQAIETIKIYDLVGSEKKCNFIPNSHLNIQHLTPGMYLLHLIFSNGAQQTKKLIIN